MNLHRVDPNLGFRGQDPLAVSKPAQRDYEIRLVLLMVACLVAVLTAGAARAAGKLGPGDRIGEMHILALDTTKPWSVPRVSYHERTFQIGDSPELLSDVWCSRPGGYVPSVKGGTYTMLCTGPMTQTLLIGPHANAPTTAQLDTYWQSSLFELFVDGQPVDVSKFTTVDLRLPGGTMRRQYAIGLTHPQGVHKVRHVFRDRQDPTNPDSTYVFDITFLTPSAAPLPATGLPPTDPHGLFGCIGLGLIVIACGLLLTTRRAKAEHQC